jgi:hypothetical protein
MCDPPLVQSQSRLAGARFPILLGFFPICVPLICLVLICSNCEDTHLSRVQIKLRDLPAEKNVPQTKVAQLPPCPPAGTLPLSQGGNHRVSLAWNPSHPTPDPNRTAVGYCLYRSKMQGAAKQEPVCKNCERINTVPVTTTNCVDNVVADSNVYYYVVTAINSNGILSAASNEVKVTIPSATQSIKSPLANSGPLCRAPIQPPAH